MDKLFNLEDAQIELEQVNNLLSIFSEFCNDECPSESEVSKLPAMVFCSRIQSRLSLIFAAQDKIIQLAGQMDTAVKSYCEAKKGGAA